MSEEFSEIDPPRPHIRDVVHKLDKRTAVLETEYSHIKQGLNDCQGQLRGIDGKVDKINKHIARQNGTLPRIEVSLNNALVKLEEHDKVVAVSLTKSKLIWASLSAIVTGLIIFLAKALIGGL